MMTSTKIDMRRTISNTNERSVNRICKKCGNKLLESGEECDDGNLLSGDGCNSTCGIETIYECSKNKYEFSTCVIACGDGIKKSSKNEFCDDGNTINLDGCSSSCTLESKYTCTTTENAKSICTGICGDGF